MSTYSQLLAGIGSGGNYATSKIMGNEYNGLPPD